MIYEHRWLCVLALSALLSAILYAYVISPQLIELDDLHQSENELAKKIMTLKRRPVQIHSASIEHQNNIDGMNVLLASLEASGLTIQSVDEVAERQNGVAMRLLMHGNYQQWTAWMSGLDQQTGAVRLKDFSCKPLSNDDLQIIMKMEFHEDKWSAVRFHSDVTAVRDPFCKTHHAWATQSDAHEILLSPLEQIKMAGYLQFGHRRAALVLLPNGVMSMVEEGVVLGKERGVVVKIERDKVVVELAKRERIFIDARQEGLPPPGEGAEGRKGEYKMQILFQQRARELRTKMTQAERKLWNKLRRRQLGGLRFRRQVHFDKYIVDFVCLESKVIIELDGSQHAEQIAYDDKRTRFLQSFGYTVIRFWNNEVSGDIESVLQSIWNVCIPPSALRAPSPVGGRPSYSGL